MKTAKYVPTSADLRAIMKAADLTGSDVAEICGVNPRTVRRWTGGDITMPYAAWMLLNQHQHNRTPPYVFVFRAAVWVSDDGQEEIILTAPHHAGMTDADLIAEAEAEARRGDILRDEIPGEYDPPTLTAETFRAGIKIEIVSG